MGHRDPGNVDLWRLAARGAALWEEEAAGIDGCAASPSQLVLLGQIPFRALSTQLHALARHRDVHAHAPQDKYSRIL